MDWRKQIKESVQRKGMTQRQFCKRAGLHLNEYNTIVNKDRNLSVKVALALEMFNVRTAYFWLNCQLKEQIKTAKNEDCRF